MIKILLGGSPCTFWSIAQKNGRETEASGAGWELFKNYLIAKEKFKPDLFLYENNKSAAQAIKDQISAELGVPLMYINSSLVSAQNRQRFYCFNWEVEQPEDRGIVLRDVLESGNSFGANGEKGYALTATYGKGDAPDRILKKHQRTMVAEPVCVGEVPEHKGTYRNGKQASQQYRVFDVNGKAVAVTTCAITNVAEPVRIPEYGVEDKSRPITASYAYKGSGEGSLASEAFPDNPNKQVRDYVAEPVRIGDIGTTAQAHRVYSCNGKSVTLSANGEGQGGKTGLYATPVCVDGIGSDKMIPPCGQRGQEKSRTITAGYHICSQRDLRMDIETDGFMGKQGVIEVVPHNVLFEEEDGSFYFLNQAGKKVTVYRVENGFITIKGKQYPIKLEDGFYIIRKLTPVECERLQTLPDGYTKAVSNSQRYKGLGNGWTAEVIIHILNGALKDVPRDEEIVVLSMYDGIGTGRYCLDKMGFTNVKYFAYEIDKYAKEVAMSNYPDIIQMGDAFDLRHPDWTIGY